MNGLHRNPTRPHPDEWEKWNSLQRAAVTDAQNPELREMAAHLLAAARNRVSVFCQLAMTMARDAIRFESDTARVGGEDIAGVTRPAAPGDALEAFERGVDDCDAKARFFVALCLAAGVPATIVDWWRDTAHDVERLAHVSAAVRVGAKTLPVELTLSRARLGDSAENVPKEADGSLKLT